MSKGKKSTQDIENEEFDRLAAGLVESPVPIDWQVAVKPSAKVSVHAGHASKRIRQVRFLKALSEVGVISAALEAAGVNHNTERQWRRSGDAWYEQQFKDALQKYRDVVETEVHNRAINGVE